MRDPGGRRQERGEGKEGEVGLLWIRWPSQKVPLKMLVQAREGFGLASMGTLVSPAYCCLCNVSPSSPPSLSPRSPSSQTEFFKSIHHHCSSSNMMTCIIFKIIISAPLISSIARSYLPSPWSVISPIVSASIEPFGCPSPAQALPSVNGCFMLSYNLRHHIILIRVTVECLTAWNLQPRFS